MATQVVVAHNFGLFIALRIHYAAGVYAGVELPHVAVEGLALARRGKGNVVTKFCFISF